MRRSRAFSMMVASLPSGKRCRRRPCASRILLRSARLAVNWTLYVSPESGVMIARCASRRAHADAGKVANAAGAGAIANAADAVEVASGPDAVDVAGVQESVEPA